MAYPLEDLKVLDLSRVLAGPFAGYRAERLRLLNDLYPDRQPVPGQQIKVVN